MNTFLQVLTAVGVLLTGIGTVRANRKVKAVHDEVTTGNGRTLGQTASAASKVLDVVRDAVVADEDGH